MDTTMEAALYACRSKGTLCDVSDPTAEEIML